MGSTVHPVIVSFARGTMLGVLGVKITKNICDESAQHRKGVVKIDTRNSIPLVMMMLHFSIQKVHID